MDITTIGVDLAKRVFAVHGADHHGKTVLRKTLWREQMVPFFVRLRPCTVAMEACGSAHYWARKLASLGHTVKLIAPQFVKPYVKGNKHYGCRTAGHRESGGITTGAYRRARQFSALPARAWG